MAQDVVIVPPKKDFAPPEVDDAQQELGRRKLGSSLFSHERRNSMSVYLVKGRGWRYDFILNRSRYPKAGFLTKREARRAEAKKRKEIENLVQASENLTTPTDMNFLELVNRRMDYVKAYNSEAVN